MLICTYLFGQKVLKITSKTLNITISADMSVCGVSAAIATAAACRAKKEELTLAVGLSLVFTSIMMIVMPIIIKAAGMPEVLGGAWMGGTIDATGAVAAAGAFLGEKALYTAATIKMIQNVLIGVIAFCVAVYWCAKVDCEPGQQVGWMEIWVPLPQIRAGLHRGLHRFLHHVLRHGSGRRAHPDRPRRDPRPVQDPARLVLLPGLHQHRPGHQLPRAERAFQRRQAAQSCMCAASPLNLILTLTMAYIMFYLVFPDITAKI